MSYILDALRKADAQRARDPARGIHAQPPTPAVPGDTGRPRRAYWGAAGAAALILIAAGWIWLSPGTPVAPPAVHAPLPPAQPVARSEPPPATQPMAPPAAPATEVLPPPPEPAVALAPRTAPAASTSAAAGAVTATTAPVVPAPAAAAPAAAVERTYSLTELPPDVLHALPKFNVTGGVYSENVAQRMLVVNGQVFNEGSEIASGVVLEQIRPRVALLKFRGLRIAQPY